jgi:aminoglycoside 6-adenylyltransferase
MAEWHARAQHGLEYNTWYGGRYLVEWADARLVQQLPAAFGGYDQSQLETALWNTIMMFTWLAQETATLLSLIYPIQVETKMIKLIRTTIDSEG